MARSPRTIYLLRQAQLLAHAEMVEPLKAFDLMPAQYVLLSLSRSEDGRSAADLARRSHITPQSMNEIIVVLERKGLIRRREYPDNRRMRVALTKGGMKLLADCDRQTDRMESELLRCLSDKELTALRTVLSKLLHENRRNPINRLLSRSRCRTGRYRVRTSDVRQTELPCPSTRKVPPASATRRPTQASRC